MSTRLTKRWYPLHYHPDQHRLWTSKARFRVVPAPRRSGKSELAKRYTVEAAISTRPSVLPDAHFVLSAPTHQQARKIFWDDVKALSPPRCVRSISESYCTIKYTNGAEIIVAGMDKPERVEGNPIDGIVLDELANMKESVWMQHVYPALGTPGRKPGWAWLIGVPEGRNHYYRLWLKAIAAENTDWEGHRWSAEGIVDQEVLDAAKRDMDQRSYDQEWKGLFVDFAGRAYYDFDPEIHAQEKLAYDPNLPLIFTFDFNVSPGTASVIQEQPYRGTNVHVASTVTAIIDEVWIANNSNTPLVCKQLGMKYQGHKGIVMCYGDASGGNRSTTQTEGNDWDLIQQYLCPIFGDRLELDVPKSNPAVRARLNAVNTRILNADRIVRLLVDPVKCPHTVDDFEGVRLTDRKGELLDKSSDPSLTHLTDGIGYYIDQEFGVYEPDGLVRSGYY